MKIGGIRKEVLVDSGSASNLISQDELKNLQSQGLNIELQSCSKKLYAYGGQKLEVVGQFKSELAVEETKVLTHFFCGQTRAVPGRIFNGNRTGNSPRGSSN